MLVCLDMAFFFSSFFSSQHRKPVKERGHTEGLHSLPMYHVAHPAFVFGSYGLLKDIKRDRKWAAERERAEVGHRGSSVIGVQHGGPITVFCPAG